MTTPNSSVSSSPKSLGDVIGDLVLGTTALAMGVPPAVVNKVLDGSRAAPQGCVVAREELVRFVRDIVTYAKYYVKTTRVDGDVVSYTATRFENTQFLQIELTHDVDAALRWAKRPTSTRQATFDRLYEQVCFDLFLQGTMPTLKNNFGLLDYPMSFGTCSPEFIARLSRAQHFKNADEFGL